MELLHAKSSAQILLDDQGQLLVHALHRLDLLHRGFVDAIDAVDVHQRGLPVELITSKSSMPREFIYCVIKERTLSQTSKS